MTRVVITGGKTGGHVFPALAVAESLSRLSSRPERSAPGDKHLVGASSLDLSYVGMAGGIEEDVVPAADIPLHPLVLVTPDRPSRLTPALFRLLVGAGRLLVSFRRRHPDVVFSTGGFVSLPATLAAWALRVPIVIYLPDVRPGRAVRFVSLGARSIAVSAPESVSLLPGWASRGVKTVVTGYPVTAAFLSGSREEARDKAGLTQDELQLLVMGGSLGARAINRAIARGLGLILPLARVLHVSGPREYTEMEAVRQGLPENLAARYDIVPFLDHAETAAAMFASDVAVTRAGASILGELPAAGLPAIVVPLPAAKVGQKANAASLMRAGACIIVSNRDSEEGKLVDAVVKLLKDRPRRARMAAESRSFFRPAAAEDIATMVLDAAGARA